MSIDDRIYSLTPAKTEAINFTERRPIAERFTELQRFKVFERPFLATVDGRWVKRLTGRELLSYTQFRGRAAESGIFLPKVTQREWDELVRLRLAECAW
jgi:hypothetical protein